MTRDLLQVVTPPAGVTKSQDYTAHVARGRTALGGPSSSGGRERAQNEVDLSAKTRQRTISYANDSNTGASVDLKPRPTIDLAGGSKRGHPRSLWVSPEIKPWMP